jgi:hypothetical protein
MDEPSLLRMTCVLVHDDNDITPLRACNSSSHHNRNGSDLMIVNTMNVNRPMRMAFNDPRVNTVSTPAMPPLAP